jgi:hypothetical protein
MFSIIQISLLSDFFSFHNSENHPSTPQEVSQPTSTQDTIPTQHLREFQIFLLGDVLDEVTC